LAQCKKGRPTCLEPGKSGSACCGSKRSLTDSDFGDGRQRVQLMEKMHISVDEKDYLNNKSDEPFFTPREKKLLW
jgi:hypothetical protein